MKPLFFNLIKTILFVQLLSLACTKSPEPPAIEAEHAEVEENHISLTTQQVKEAGISFVELRKQKIGTEIRVNGIIDVPPQNRISIHIPYGGFVKAIEMLPGSKVSKGQLLAVIENPEFVQFQQDYMEAVANRSFYKSEFERQQTLLNEEAGAAKNYQQAKSTFQANEARFLASQEKLRLIGFDTTDIKKGIISGRVSIHSTVDGFVRAVNFNVGSYVDEKDVIMEITGLSDLHVELSVYENEVALLKEGQRIRFEVATLPGVWQTAEIFLIGREVRDDKTVTVHGHIEKSKSTLLPGMYISASIETGTVLDWAVPEESIILFGGKNYVFAYSDDEHSESEQTFEMLEIQKLTTSSGFTRISFSDVTTDPGALRIVKTGAYALLSKAKNSESDDHGH